MAELSPDKMKRFRLHVVEEIYRTEKEYTGKLEFTVSVSRSIDLPMAGRSYTQYVAAIC